MKIIYLLVFIAFFCFHVNAQSNPFQPDQINDGWQTENPFENNSNLQEMDSLIKIGGFKQISSVVIAHRGKVVFEKDRKSTRLNSSHVRISYAVFCLKKKKNDEHDDDERH